jgi:hypothetical protein
MRFILIHKTNARWEAGEKPAPELVARVGALIGDMTQAGVFVDGAGLRASSEGVRLRFAGGGAPVVAKGPFVAGNELPAAFTIVSAPSLDEAVDYATRQARILGDVEIDIRPVTEPWDIGLSPPPAEIRSRRYMLLRKATPATESGAAPTVPQRDALARLESGGRPGVQHLVTETMRPSRRGRRCRNNDGDITVIDGPFTETKELIAGYAIVSAGSLDEAERWARRYLVTVGASEADVRELE